MLREGHLLHGPPRNLQEGRASHGSIAPGIDNSETASGLRSLCRPTHDSVSMRRIGDRSPIVLRHRNLVQMRPVIVPLPRRQAVGKHPHNADDRTSAHTGYAGDLLAMWSMSGPYGV